MLAANRHGAPQAFCWTRFGTEAGEGIERILDRKEQERQANDGVFLWGIGNAVGPGIAELLKRCEQPEVLFSPIRGRPRTVDVSPSAILAWTRAETLDGQLIELPPTTRVTSRHAGAAAPRPHYALVCTKNTPLAFSDLGSLSFRDVRNLVSGRAVGASQVTAVVRRVADDVSEEPHYPITLRASLAPPFFLRLRDPIMHSPRQGSTRKRTAPTEWRAA
jgi:hypothetical protein